MHVHYMGGFVMLKMLKMSSTFLLSYLKKSLIKFSCVSSELLITGLPSVYSNSSKLSTEKGPSTDDLVLAGKKGESERTGCYAICVRQANTAIICVATLLV